MYFSLFGSFFYKCLFEYLLKNETKLVLCSHPNSDSCLTFSHGMCHDSPPKFIMIQNSDPILLMALSFSHTHQLNSVHAPI